MKLIVDIGTTTVAMTVIDEKSGLRTEEVFLNQQRFFGVDVISRIKAANEGSGEMLRSLIQKCLLQGIRNLLGKSGVQPEDVESVTIAANTVMVHLLLSYSCEELGAYPFTPVTLDTLLLSFEEVFGDSLLACPVTILPGISAYVGGDIVSGIYYTDLDQAEELSFFLDLGTNGEMVLGNQKRLLVTSTAAGPAFEGGNIKYGMAAIKGAIHQVEILEKKARFKTIQYGRPLGLCGSGIIDLVAELLKNNLIDDTGLLIEPYFTEGFPVTLPSNGGEDIRLFQKDIREVQMAKSAIYTGIELLCQEMGCTLADIQNVYLAGTFGSAANLENAIAIGLLPDAFQGKIKVLGNSSLLGGIKYATKAHSALRIEEFIKKTDVLYLSNTSDFETSYIEHINFSKYIEE